MLYAAMIKTIIEQTLGAVRNGSPQTPLYGSGVRTPIRDRTSTGHDSVQDAFLSNQRVLPILLKRLLDVLQTIAIVGKSGTEVTTGAPRSRQHPYRDRTDAATNHSHLTGGSN